MAIITIRYKPQSKEKMLFLPFQEVAYEACSTPGDQNLVALSVITRKGVLFVVIKLVSHDDS